MATFTASITNSMTIFGCGPTMKWGVMVWGVDAWGESLPLTKNVSKFILDEQSFTVAFVKNTSKNISNDQTISGILAKKPSKQLFNTVAVESDVTDIGRFLSGYNYVFSGNTTNGSNQIATSYTTVNASSDVYTTFTTATNTWTKV